MYVGFDEFGEEPLLSLLQGLAETKALTVVVGAGSSVESGLPTWRSLVEELLRNAARRHGLNDEACDRFSDWTTSREDLTGAGEVAKGLLSERQFRESLKEIIYGSGALPLPGETARAIAALRVSRIDDPFEIVTTNYDTLLEAAIRDELGQRRHAHKVKSIVNLSSAGPSEVGVRHVHGVLTPGDRLLGTLVLSDRDYHLMQQPDSWQEAFFKDRLQGSTCLFVGTSLTDPNLLRYIYRSGHGTDHTALFVRQGDAALYEASGNPVARLREESQARKWRAVHIRPTLVDYYSQGAQLLWEIWAAQQGPYVSLPQRLDDWFESLSHGILSTGAGFTSRQDALHQFMEKALSGVLDLLHRSRRIRGKGERIGMSLWIYQPHDDSLINWASADRAWRDPTTLEPVRIEWNSNFVATQAFCSGSVVSQSTSRFLTSRWNHVFAFPIYLHQASGRLPVGAVTLASTRDLERSLLHRGDETIRSQAIPYLERLMSDLLDPTRQ